MFLFSNNYLISLIAWLIHWLIDLLVDWWKMINSTVILHKTNACSFSQDLQLGIASFNNGELTVCLFIFVFVYFLFNEHKHEQSEQKWNSLKPSTHCLHLFLRQLFLGVAAANILPQLQIMPKRSIPCLGINHCFGCFFLIELHWNWTNQLYLKHATWVQAVFFYGKKKTATLVKIQGKEGKFFTKSVIQDHYILIEDPHSIFPSHIVHT